MVNAIELRRVLPQVFASADENADAVSKSDIWLKDVTLRRGESYLVCAESGTGKSSLCNYLFGNRTDYTGRISFDGSDIAGFAMAQWCALRRDTLSWMPQELDLFPELTVMENILLKNRLTGFKSKEWIRHALERMEVADRADRPAGRISVGQQQRVALIRALCQPFSFLLLDEPVSHLDSRRASEAAMMVAEVALSQGAAVIATSVGNNIPLPDVHVLKL